MTHAALVLAAVLVTCQACAGSVTLAWDRPDDDRVIGYEVHYGRVSTSYQWMVTVDGADITTVPISGLQPGTWYFAARSEGASGPSVFSNEVTTCIDCEAAAPHDPADGRLIYRTAGP